MTRFFYILNPTAGRGASLQQEPALQDFVRSNQIDGEIVHSQRVGHALELARDAALKGYDIVVSVGGDGTANEVLNGLMQAKSRSDCDPVMAVLPSGRGNDFAYGVGVPDTFSGALEGLKTPQKAHAIDVGRITGGNFPEGRFFGNGVGIGFDAVVGFEAVKLKYLTGFPSYIVAALKTIFLYYKAPQLDITLAGEKIHGRFLMVSIMNGMRMGGGFYMAPNGDPGDGQFTICLVEAMGKMATFPMILKFMKGTQSGDDRVRMVNSPTVLVEASEASLPCHADGETVCEKGRSVKVEILPGALKILTS